VASKDIQYSESMPEETSRYLIVLPHAVFFCFDTDQYTLLPKHTNFIEHTMVPFIGRALKRLGPGSYDLMIHGSASATGPTDHNFELGARRATNVADYTIQQFEKQKKSDPSLVPFTLNPNILNHGDEDSDADPSLPGARKMGNSQVEKVQALYRCAMFPFRAEQTNKSSIFQIREIYYFKFTKIEEDLPTILREIDDFLDKPVPGFVFGQLKDRILAPVKEALGSVGFLANHMIGYMIPKTVDYCYEIKDSLNDHALYRFHGSEHKDDFSAFDVISFATKLMGAIKALETISKGTGLAANVAQKIYGAADGLNKITDDLINLVYPYLEKTLGTETARQVKQLVISLRGGSRTLFSSLTIPASPFTPFRYHDRQADHDVKQLDKPARRNLFGAAYNTVVDLSFGGSASYTSIAWMAEAHIVSGFSIRNSLAAWGVSDGMLIPIKLGYLKDVAPGFADPITA
jgi:hypothetical protein